MTSKIGFGTIVTAAIGAAAIIFISGMTRSRAAEPARPAPRAEAAQFAQNTPRAGATNTASTRIPEGASSLQETYQDWMVICARQPAGQTPAERCAMTQQQLNGQSRQRVLAMELVRTAAGADGMLFLPFGVDLEKGVTFQIDDGVVSTPHRFRTCLPAGCMVPFSLDAAMLGRLERGSTLKVVTTAVEGDGELAFSLSLRGFAAANARLAALRR